MSLFLVDWIKSFCLLGMFSILIYSIGYFIYSSLITVESDDASSFFTKLAIGLIGIVMFYAIVRTSCLTIYLGVLISFAYYFFSKRKKKWFSNMRLKKFEKKMIINYLIVMTLVTFLFSYLFYFDNRLFIHQDLSFYGRLGSSLHKFGVEIPNTDPFFIFTPKATIYHFFNEWMVALLMNVSNFSSLKILLLLVLPIQIIIIIMGGFALVDSQTSEANVLKKMIVAFFLILIPGILSFLINLGATQSIQMPYSIVLGGIVDMKVKIISILLLLLFINVPKGNKQKDYLILSLIPLFWNTLIPAFLGGYIMLFIYNLLNKKIVSKHQYAQLLLPILFIPFYLLILNIFYKNNYAASKSVSDFGLINYIVLKYSNFAYVTKTILLYGVPSVIFFGILIRYYDKAFDILKTRFIYFDDSKRMHLLILIFISIASFFSFGLLRELFNGRQILMNLFYPLFTLILFEVVINVFNKSRYLVFSGLVIVLIFISFHLAVFGSTNLPKIIEKVKLLRDSKSFTPYLIASDINKNEPPFSLYSKPYSYLLMQDEYYKPIRLDIVKDTMNMSLQNKLEYYESVSGQLFFKYVNANIEKSLAENKCNFINKYKIDYLLIDSTSYYTDTTYLKRISVSKIIPFAPNVLLLKLQKN